MTSDLSYRLIYNLVSLSAKFSYRLEVYGREENIIDNLDILREGAILAGNHESVIDAFLMGLTLPPELRVYFLGKKSALWRNRFWGKMMDYFGVIPVESKGRNKKVIKKGMEILEKKQLLGIFPEGHIRYSRKSLDGKVGVARFAFETERPVIPMGIIGTDGVLPYGGNWPSIGKKVTIYVGEPIFLSDNYDKSDIFNYEALRQATDLIMYNIRLLSKGYGINPLDAPNLTCMKGITKILLPPEISNYFYELAMKNNNLEQKFDALPNDLVSRFENWMEDISIALKEGRKKNLKDIPPPKGSTEKFLDWLDNQL